MANDTSMRAHELHPMLIHAPLVMLPAAAAVELISATASGRIRRRAFSIVGSKLWWGTAASGLLAGLAGMAASQEVEADDHARDMMFVHGIGNFTLVLAALGLATWRTTHRATMTTGLIGAGAVLAATYTAWLGGEMVYSHGVGVKHRGKTEASMERNPPLLSARAPGRLARDAAVGLGWLMRRLVGVARRRDRVQLRPMDTSPAISEGVFTAPY